VVVGDIHKSLHLGVVKDGFHRVSIIKEKPKSTSYILLYLKAVTTNYICNLMMDIKE
jgi:hypothetical protein